MSIDTPVRAGSTSPVRPGSPELAALLERLAVGASEREQKRIAPHEQIGWVKEAGLGRLRVPVARSEEHTSELQSH